MEAVGLYDFNPTGSDELCFKKGDVLKVRWMALCALCVSHLSVQGCLVRAVVSRMWNCSIVNGSRLDIEYRMLP